jgi:hypothetical protein
VILWIMCQHDDSYVLSHVVKSLSCLTHDKMGAFSSLLGVLMCGSRLFGWEGHAQCILAVSEVWYHQCLNFYFSY